MQEKRKPLLLLYGFMLLQIVGISFTFVTVNTDSLRQEIQHAAKLIKKDIDKADSLSEGFLNQEAVQQNDTLTAKAYLLRGIVYYNQSKYRLSNYFFRKALHSIYAQGDQDFRAQVLNNKGASHASARQYDSAFMAYQKSLEIDKAMNHQHDIAETQLNMGVMTVKTGELEKGESLFKNAKSFFKEDNDSIRLTKCYQNLGIIKRRQGKTQKAIEYQQKANALFKALTYYPGMMQTYSNLVNLYTDQKRFDKALALVDSIENLAQKYPGTSFKVAAPLQRAKVLVLQGKPEPAGQILDSLGNQKTKLAEYGELQQYNDVKLKWAAQKGDLATARETFKSFVNRKDSLHQVRINQNLSELKVLHQVDKKNAMIDKQEKIIAIKSTRNTWLTVALIVVVTLLVSLIVFYYKNKQLWTAVTNLNLSSTLAFRSSVTQPSESSYQHHQLFHQIETLIKEKEWYKDPHLTLKMLANELGTNEYYISRAINEMSGMNFNGYVNNYRINLAKKSLLEDGQPNNTIASVADEVGFSSSNSFSRTFKKLTGMSPSEFAKLNAG